jgi:hypothetical protein
MKIIFLLLSLSVVTGCIKTKTAASTVGDEVIGTYTDYNGAQQVKVQVYKTGNQKYGIRKLSTASFPEFTFQYKLNLFDWFAYEVPAQGNIVTDSSFAGYFVNQRRFGFTIKENNGAKWTYDGFK